MIEVVEVVLALLVAVAALTLLGRRLKIPYPIVLVVGGLLLALNIGTVVPFIERVFSIQFLDKSVYYISELPSHLLSSDITLISLIALTLALLAMIYLSWRASKVNPAEALRYE